MKKISVIIPTYNRSLLLSITLKSLREQTLPIRFFEVIVADDGSSDNTKEIVENFRSELDLKYCYQEDKGFRVAKARNMGIAKAETKICLFVDSGVYLDRKCLEEHIRLHEEEKHNVVIGNVYGFTSSKVNKTDLKNAIATRGVKYALEKCIVKNEYADRRIPHYEKYGGNINNIPAPWVFFWTCHVSVTTERLREIGGFDEAFTSWGGEDIELGYRLYCNGSKFYVGKNAISLHYPHEHDSNEQKKSDKENLDYVHRKHNTEITKMLTEIHIMDINDKLLSLA